MTNTANDALSTSVRLRMALLQETRRDLAQALGVTVGAIGHKLTGHTRWSMEDLDKLAAHYEVPAAVLLQPPVEAFAGSSAGSERVTRHEHVPAQRRSGTVLLLPLPARRWLVAAA